MDRRQFLGIAASALVTAHLRAERKTIPPEVMTVRGPVAASKLGFALPHEHVLVDFIGADKVSPARYNRDAAFKKILPYLEEAKALGVRTVCECTPASLGRDPRLLLRLAEATGLHLLTNTGYYSARKNKFLPPDVLAADADTLAARWLTEWRDGIDGTAVRPGFIKIGVDGGTLTEQGRKLITAAARTHRQSGLVIAAHTGDEVAAKGQLEILQAEKIPLASWIWVHAQNARAMAPLLAAAQAGAWISLDNVGSAAAQNTHLAKVVAELKRQNLLSRVLISHDAGWYQPGEPDGGKFRGFDALTRVFIPALREAGLTTEDIDQLTILNPARAFALNPPIL